MGQPDLNQSAGEILAELRGILGADRVITDAEELRFFNSDVYSAGVAGLAAIQPDSIEALASAVSAATRAGCPIVTRGGGMSYTGGYTPAAANTITVDMRGFNQIIEVDAEDMVITVQAGVTWEQIYERLKPMGLRLPFFGTFSGSVATVGGGLSNGALFMGTGRYGTAAEIVLGIQVLLADGRIVDTGQAAFRNGRPFYRTYGPDLTGMFLHDTGALGIKTQASLRMMRAPERTDFASFVVPDIQQAAAALSEVARAGIAEEAYVFDPETTRNNLEGGDLGQDFKTLLSVIGQAPGLLKGLREGASLVASGRNFVPEETFSLHVVCAGRSEAAVNADLDACRKIMARLGGHEIVNSMPKAARAEPFPPLNGILGPEGDRWAALNAKVRHSDAPKIIAATQALLAPYESAMQAHKITLSQLMIAISNHAFSYEPVFHWYDEWLPVHRRSPDPGHLAKLQEPAANPEARALVHEIRAKLVALFAEMGAASNQIGKTYPYLESLQPETADTLRALKAALDPKGLMNPGALGLALPAAAD